jgi:hypothetical protein
MRSFGSCYGLDSCRRWNDGLGFSPFKPGVALAKTLIVQKTLM